MNDPAGFGFLVIIVVVVVVVVIASQVHYKNGLRNAYKQVARRFQGTCDAGGWRQLPSVTFTYENTYVLLNIDVVGGGRQKKHYTQVQMSWPDIQLRCEVYPAGLLNRIGNFLGMGDVKIGVPRFDADYVIHGNNVAALREFLTPGVRNCIDELRVIGGGYLSFAAYETERPPRSGHIYLSVGGGRLLIKKLGRLHEFDELEKFVQSCLRLYDAAIADATKGIEFIKPVPSAKLSLSEAVCQVCGESVELEPVFCRTCKTPHHKDCWEYYGACSTYGCGQRRYSKPRGMTTL